MARPDILADVSALEGTETGTLLSTSGWTPGEPALLAGDFFSLGSGQATRLHQVTADALADADGHATLQCVPRLRRAIRPGAAVEVAAPGLALRLTAPVPTRISRADRHRFTVSAREAL